MAAKLFSCTALWLCLAIGGCASGQPNFFASMATADRAAEYVERGDFYGAASLYSDIGHGASMWSSYAPMLLSYQVDDQSGAIQAAERALSSATSPVRKRSLLLIRSHAHLLSYRADEAIADALAALEIGTDSDYLAHGSAGIATLVSGDVDRARYHFRKVLEHTKGVSDPYERYARGIAHIVLGENDAAIREADAALDAANARPEYAASRASTLKMRSIAQQRLEDEAGAERSLRESQHLKRYFVARTGEGLLTMKVAVVHPSEAVESRMWDLMLEQLNRHEDATRQRATETTVDPSVDKTDDGDTAASSARPRVEDTGIGPKDAPEPKVEPKKPATAEPGVGNLVRPRSPTSKPPQGNPAK